MTIASFVALLKARKWTVLSTVVIAIVATTLMSLSTTPLYTAQSRVLVKALPTTTAFTSAPQFVNLETEREIATSIPVAERVAHDLETDLAAASLLGGLSVQPLVETEVLLISYTSADPAFAREAADSFAVNYIDYRRREAIKELLAAQDSIQRRVSNATSEIQALDQQIADAEEDESLRVALETQRNALLARLGVLQQRLDDVQPDRSVRLGGGKVIAPAFLPTAPSSPNHGLNIMMATFLGLGMGMGLALLRERLDDRIRDRSALESVLKVPVLTSIPRFSTKGKNRQPLLVLDDPHGAATEAFRSLRTNVEFLASQQAIKSLLITSPAAGEGKTTTTSNLAVALAQTGRKVIVISADLRRPKLEGYFGLEGALPGLTDTLTGDWPPPPTILHESGIENLRILPAGRPPHNPAELMTSPRIGQLLKMFAEASDLVLVDSAPVLAVTDATVLAREVSATILVINASSTRRSAAQHATEELQRVGGRVLGAVLNGVESDRSTYYYGSYSYGNGEVTNGKGRRAAAREKKRAVLDRGSE